MLKICKQCHKQFNSLRSETKFCTEKCLYRYRKGTKKPQEWKDKIRQSLIETNKLKKEGKEKMEIILARAERMERFGEAHNNFYAGDKLNLIEKRDLNIVIKIKELKDAGQNSKQIALALNVSLKRVNKLWVKTILINETEQED